MGKGDPVEGLADAFKTEAMKGAWPTVSKILTDNGVANVKSYDALFDKKANVTAMSDAGNKKLVALSAAILDAVVREFTNERETEVMAQTQNVRIKSKIRAAIEKERKNLEKGKDTPTGSSASLSLEERMEAAGLQSFFNQLENIDGTAVIKVRREIEKKQAIEEGQKAVAGQPLSALQLAHGKTVLVEYANEAKVAPSSKLKDVAAKVAAKLASKKIQSGQLDQLFAMLDVFNTGAAVKWKDELKAALKGK